MKEAYIIDAVRTPIGRYGGVLSSIRPDDLAALVIKALLERNKNIDVSLIEDVILGCTNQAGEDNRNIARMASLRSGLPVEVGGVTVNRLCASGMQAIMDAARAIMVGDGDIFIAGGVESMSRAPYIISKSEKPFGRKPEIYDSTIGWRFINKKLTEKYFPFSMGETAENIAEKWNISREDQDQFAYNSQQKYKSAFENGKFNEEIIPVPVPQKKNKILIDEFRSFFDTYQNKYNLPIKQKTLFKILQQTQIISLDNCNNYSFYYQYLYYFFVAKYLAEHIEDNKKVIDSIISNLHKDENAYIAIFISHHSKNVYVLDEIILNAYSLFDKYNTATLSKEELSFFDEQVDIIIKEVLPPTNVTPEKERVKRLETQDVAEQINIDEKKKIVLEEENDNDLAMELRRSIKTVEVMGRIIKNRAGSLKKSRLEFIFGEAMRVHLRILSSFFELIKNDEAQQEIVNFISNRLNKIVEDKEKKDKEKKDKPRPLSQKKLKKLSKVIFWNSNLFVVYGFIYKIIHSLGSNKLTEIIEKVCDNENTPASFLLKHGILMWYNKNLQIDNIVKRIEEGGFSEIAKKVMRFMIVDHCSMHLIGFKEKQKIENKLGMSSQRLLIQQAKGNG